MLRNINTSLILCCIPCLLFLCLVVISGLTLEFTFIVEITVVEAPVDRDVMLFVVTKINTSNIYESNKESIDMQIEGIIYL